MPDCSNCHAPNREGAKFCARCGHGLGLACPACGAAYQADDAFCVECGSPLGGQTRPVAAAVLVRDAPSSERRLVSILFADLVGFTSLSESRDSEEVRELLSSYFELARTLIERYGGTVEKFIGDAVMAVWGTPTATEDDAERAVRAALELVAGVPDLDPELSARGGVLTGEAAVTIGAEGQGMVAGDLVNTASRIQSAAVPGTVLVGGATRRATAQAIAYEDAGMHELKGKAEPVELSRAVRVVSGVGGTLKSTGLEAPFVGRDRELRLIKDLFHTSAGERKAHLVSVTGIAGTGKSRLVWEFYKYFDGIVEEIWWHRGRCLAYGDGVAYWALADMVRMRCGISEEERPDSARTKLRDALAGYLADAEERAFVEPRLAHLIGLEERPSGDRQELFAAWRLFFERLADTGPVVLAFEDMQWADSSLLDFIEYLLEWSRDFPLYVVTLGRPELQERRPGWGAGQRSFTSVYLDALPESAMQELLDGLAPGLPEALRDQILTRAEGVPLYAMETVRMLLDRGLLEREGDLYRPTGEIARLDVPETLHALVAARLDGLSHDERRSVQDASVIGKTFTRQALSAVRGLSDADLEPLLGSLVRKEILGVHADPRSPERGQYGFLQDLVRRVAYETLSKRERKSRHLAAARYLETSWAAGEQEIVEVIASHFLAAYEALPDADDAAEIRRQAHEQLAQAGERASSLGALAEAQHYFEQAAELALERLEQARLLERAGAIAKQNAEFESAERLLTAALALLEAEGDAHAAARVAGLLGHVEFMRGRGQAALERMERAYETVAKDEPDRDLALLGMLLGRVHMMMGNFDAADGPSELAIELGEALRLPDVICSALGVKAAVAGWRGSSEQRAALAHHALRIAIEQDVPEQALGARINISDLYFLGDRYDDALVQLDELLPLTRRIGMRRFELMTLSESTYPLYMRGRWDEALEAFALLPDDQLRTYQDLTTPLQSILEIHLHRGCVEDARALLALYEYLDETDDAQNRSMYAAGRAALFRAEGKLEEAVAEGAEAAKSASTLTPGFQGVKQGLVEAAEAAIALGQRERALELPTMVESLLPGRRPPYLEAHAHRIRGRLDDDEQQFKLAQQIFDEYGIVFWLAVTRLEHAESVAARGRADEADALLAEARESFVLLGARPWLERVERAGAEVAA